MGADEEGDGQRLGKVWIVRRVIEILCFIAECALGIVLNFDVRNIGDMKFG